VAWVRERLSCSALSSLLISHTYSSTLSYHIPLCWLLLSGYPGPRAAAPGKEAGGTGAGGAAGGAGLRPRPGPAAPLGGHPGAHGNGGEGDLERLSRSVAVYLEVGILSQDPRDPFSAVIAEDFIVQALQEYSAGKASSAICPVQELIESYAMGFLVNRTD